MLLPSSSSSFLPVYRQDLPLNLALECFAVLTLTLTLESGNKDFFG